MNLSKFDCHPRERFGNIRRMSDTYFTRGFYGWLQKIYCSIESIPVLGYPFQAARPSIEKFLLWHTRPERRKSWQDRVALAVSSTDNQYIPRVPEAGKTIKGIIYMHNGIRVFRNSYAGEGMRMLMETNKGVHEPQEERYYAEVLKTLPTNPVMLELGAWWGFYSMWLKKERPAARCVLVEPNASNLIYGKKNFRLNGISAEFIQAFINKASGGRVEGVEVVSVDELMKRCGLEHLSLLHADIQGYEMEMLKGALKTLEAGKVDYFFVSTHSDELHLRCTEYLKRFDYRIAADIPPSRSFTVDGILVAAHPRINYPKVELSINTQQVIPVTL